MSTVPIEPYVRPNAAAVREICEKYDVPNQFWIQAYNFPAGAEHEAADAIQIAVEEGMTDLAVWAYRGCEAMSALWSADIDKTWDTVVSALREIRA